MSAPRVGRSALETITRISRVALVSTLTLMLAGLLGCREGTGNGDWTKHSPDYYWQGRVVDAVTGTPITTPIFAVRESEEHLAQGWAPLLSIQAPVVGDDYLLTYSINGISCDPPRDTVFMLTLEIADSLGRYRSTSHVSQWHFLCSTEPPDPFVPLPFPTEKDLVFELQPGPP